MNARTKALGISRSVRAEVYERDSWDGAICCVTCGKVFGLELHHFIPRSLSGLGVPENLIVICQDCHQKADHGDPREREGMKKSIRAHLQHKYPDWDESALCYRREP